MKSILDIFLCGIERVEWTVTPVLTLRAMAEMGLLMGAAVALLVLVAVVL
ncbi:MAG: hypothetical protein WCB19_01795 [Thermoplasmata archaeon]